MIRSSSAYRICTHRPNFNEEAHDAIYGVVKKKADLAGVLLNSETIDSLCETKGMMTDAKKLRTSFENKFKAENDPLPDGAKTYLEERWLELNQNFHDFSLSGDSFAVNKGNFSEDAAIEVLEDLTEVSSLKDEEMDVIGELISNMYGAIEVNTEIKKGTSKKEALNGFMKRVLGSIDQ